MGIYAVQVETRLQERYIKIFCANNPDARCVKLHFPKRKMRNRRHGEFVFVEKPVFSGYIFAELDKGVSMAEYIGAFRSTDGFVRVLPSSKKPRELTGADLEIAAHFIFRQGGLAGMSKVHFDENARVAVLEGPLLGLEGRIIKVDRRKGRAKVKLDFCHSSFTIDLAFDEIAARE